MAVVTMICAYHSLGVRHGHDLLDIRLSMNGGPGLPMTKFLGNIISNQYLFIYLCSYFPSHPLQSLNNALFAAAATYNNTNTTSPSSQSRSFSFLFYPYFFLSDLLVCSSKGYKENQVWYCMYVNFVITMFVCVGLLYIIYTEGMEFYKWYREQDTRCQNISPGRHCTSTLVGCKESRFELYILWSPSLYSESQ